MTVLNTGTTKKYAAGWENIFGGKKGPQSKAGGSKKSTKKSPPKKKSGGK